MSAQALQRQSLALGSSWFDHFWTSIDDWAPDQNLLVLGGARSRFSLIALSWDEGSWADFRAQQPSFAPQLDREAWTTGTLALVGYESGEGRVFRLRRTLVIDHESRSAEICSEEGWQRCSFQRLPPDSRASGASEPVSNEPIWQSTWSDEAYKEAVRGALEDIRSGRYYQINLLRYWFSRDAIPRSRWLQQLARMGGPFSAYIDVPDLSLVSFSPERFFRLGVDAEGRWIETEPIKGTRPVSADPRIDQENRQALMASSKDAAELNMIVDLLRNDLFRVSRPGSVKVLDAGSLHSFANVHHRIARIRGRLRDDQTLATLMDALCPGGSITGAPKREVQKAILEKEGRPRLCFMGNIMYMDAFTGRLDSSILIRTAVRQKQGFWEFAAGSGLVIHSDPAEELAEILVKARVLPGSFADAYKSGILMV